MGRDYAPRGGGARQTRSKTKGSAMPGWVWLVAGLSVGLAVAAFVYIGRPASAMPGFAQRAAAPVEAVEPPAEPRKKPRPTVALPPKEKPRFTFYELLPNQEVVVPRNDPKDANAGAAPPGEGTYLIQVASYRSQDEAERQKAALALLGVESRIETVTIDGKDTFYRVRIGPERNVDRVNLIVSRLEENGIQALVVKVK